MDKVQELQMRGRLQNLYQEHRDLDAAIAVFESSGKADALQLQRLKKMKLSIKDQISKIENILLPDIIA